MRWSPSNYGSQTSTTPHTPGQSLATSVPVSDCGC